MLKNIITAAALGLSLAAAGGLAMADEAPAPAKTSVTGKHMGATADRIKAAQDLMATGIADQFLNSQKIVDAVISRIKTHEANIDPDLLKTVRTILIEEFDGSKDEMLKQFTIMYAAHFSVADLKAMAEFYRTPAGQHLIAQTPELGAESAHLVLPFMYHAMKRMREEMMAKMAKKAEAARAKDDAKAENKADKKAGEGKK